MTISSTTNKVTVNGNGSATVFTFTFAINDADHLQVTKRDEDGVKTILTRGGGSTQYTVNVANYPGSGSITYPSTGSLRLESGEKLVIKRVVPKTQLTDLENQSGYFAEVQEATFDYGRMIDLDLQEQLDRSIKLPIDTSGSVSPELPLPEADKYLKWNSAGTALENADGTGEGEGGGGEVEPPTLSGTILLENGSASAPSHSFENAPSSGMWWTSSSGLKFGEGGNGDQLTLFPNGTITMATPENNGNPALQVVPVADQTKRVIITGSTGSAGETPSILAAGTSAGNTPLLIGAEPGGQGRLRFSGLTVMGIDATQHGVEKDVEEDQAQNLEDLANWVSAAGGGTIWFPSGDYYFDIACNLPSNIRLKGQGQSSVRFMMGAQGIIRTAGNYAFDEEYVNARLRSTTASGTNVWHIDTGHAGGVISRFTPGSKWRVRGAGGGDIEVRDRIDITVDSTDGVDDVTSIQNADVDYLVSWSAGSYPEAAAYEALYGETDYTYLDKFVMSLLLADADRGVDQTITIATDEASPYTVGGYYLLADDQEEIDVAGTLHNRGNIEIVQISEKADLGGNVTELTLAAPVSRNFRIADGAALYQIEWVENVVLEDIDFVSYEIPTPAPASRVPMIEMRFVKNWECKNLRFDGEAPDQMGRRGNIYRCYYSVHGGFTNCFGSYPGYTGSGEGYIFSMYNSRDVWCDKCHAVGGRHNYLTQVGTDIRFTNSVSYDCKISDIDGHGVNEVGLTIANMTIKQSELRSDSANASVAAIRLGNTAHPLGTHDVTITNVNIFGNGSTDSRGIDIVPPSSHILINGVKMYQVYDGIYCRSNLDEDLQSHDIRISDVQMNQVGRYGLAFLGDADAGFTGYQIKNVTIDGVTVAGTNRPIIAHEVDTMVVKDVTVFGLDQVTSQTSFDFDDIVDLDMQNTTAFNVYRGWSLTDCPKAFIWGGQVDYNSSIMVDNGGNTNMRFRVGAYDDDDPTYTVNSASTGKNVSIPGRQVEYEKDDAASIKYIRTMDQATYDLLTPAADTLYVIV